MLDWITENSTSFILTGTVVLINLFVVCFFGKTAYGRWKGKDTNKIIKD